MKQIAKKETLEALQARYSETQVSNIEQVIKQGERSIAYLKREYSDEVVKALLVVEIDKLLRFFNLSKSMDDFQIVETIKLIQQDYYYLSILDFKLFFNRLRKGEYGSLYGKIDGLTILERLNQYDLERTNTYQTIRANENIRHKKENDKPMSKEVAEKLREMFKDKPIKKAERKQSKDLSPTQRWIKQFDNLYLKYGENKGIRTILINGSRFDLNQFLNRKLMNNGDY